MKQVSIILLLFFFAQAKAQVNLVPNPSFEDTVACPVLSGNMPSDWSSYAYTPDYYNTCASSISSCYGIPNNWLGYQFPLSGNAYMGVLTYDGRTGSSNREYIGCPLVSSLVPGTKYFVTLYISKSSKNPCTCSSNKFGIRFTNHAYSTSSPLTPDNFSHIHSDIMFTDTSNWNKISGSLFADSAYQYLIIGNFYDNLNTTTSGCSTEGAYYYIDDICISTDSLYCELFSAISENTETLNSFKVFPNPTAGKIFIRSKIKTKTLANLYNCQGQLLTQLINPIELDLAEFPIGIYYLEILYNSKKSIYKILRQ